MGVNSKSLLNFKLAILRRGLKNKEVAKKLGISTGHLSNMLRNHDSMNDEVRKKLNKLLNTNY